MLVLLLHLLNPFPVGVINNFIKNHSTENSPPTIPLKKLTMNAATITHPSHSPIKTLQPKYQHSNIVFITINIPVPISKVNLKL